MTRRTVFALLAYLTSSALAGILKPSRATHRLRSDPETQDPARPETATPAVFVVSRGLMVLTGATVETEHDRVIRWRVECLLEAGYPADMVPALADSRDVDLTVACHMLAEGCDPLVAIDILL